MRNERNQINRSDFMLKKLVFSTIVILYIVLIRLCYIKMAIINCSYFVLFKAVHYHDLSIIHRY